MRAPLPFEFKKGGESLLAGYRLNLKFSEALTYVSINP